MEKMITKGFVNFCRHYVEQLKTRKLVALFDDYELAKKDIIMEVANGSLTPVEAFERAVAVLETETDVQDYWDNLGK